jgi:WD40-like Beta Propeller Repeat
VAILELTQIITCNHQIISIMQKITTLFILVFLFSTYCIKAQDKNLKDDAAYYFDNKDYKKAYELYDKLLTQTPTNLEYKFRLGYCCLNYPDKKMRAIELFEDLKKTDKSTDINCYLGKAYRINYKFDQAIVAYNQFLTDKGTKIKEEDKQLIEDAKLGLKNCSNGKELIAKKIIADIKNIGLPINTEEIEGVPVISADESIMIYTYAGKKSTGGLLDEGLKPDAINGVYREDIFISTRASDSTFSDPVGIIALNTNGNDAAVALSPDGTTLFSFISNNDEGDLFISNLSGTEWSKPIRLNKNINTDAWEGSCSITADGRYLYFASERPGGLGGRDLYISEKVNGDWAPAVNLGPSINTIYNEDAPFIHPDGITLFFSSEGHKSIGGYDIMYSIKQENNWIAPLSMGIPLNTTEDDRYYVINAQGDRGYFSSNRASAGGKGEQDIYTVEPGILGDRPILALLKGNVYADDKPVEAKIEITKKITNEAIGPYYANSKTGKYLMALSPGNGYKIKILVSVEGFEPIEEELDIEKLQKFVEIKKDFYVYSSSYVNKKDQKSVKSILDSLLGNTTPPEAFKNDVVTTPTIATTQTVATTSPCNGGDGIDFSALKGKSLNDIATYSKLLEIAGNICSEGLVFKVQIAAYRNPQNYKYERLLEFGKPEKTSYPDGITRFTQLQFSTLKEAETARQKIIAKGQTDAWVTGFVNGKRYTLEDLISVNFLGKSIN